LASRFMWACQNQKKWLLKIWNLEVDHDPWVGWKK
jgi:hypothetical protein